MYMYIHVYIHCTCILLLLWVSNNRFVVIYLAVNSEVYVLVQIEKERDNTSLLPRHSCPRWNQTFEM